MDGLLIGHGRYEASRSSDKIVEQTDNNNEFHSALLIACYISDSLAAVEVLMSFVTVNVSLMAGICLRVDPPHL